MIVGLYAVLLMVVQMLGWVGLRWLLVGYHGVVGDFVLVRVEWVLT